MTRRREIRIGTRGSLLALRQSEWVAEELRRACPDLTISLVRIRTKGDRFRDAPFLEIGEKGLFVKEIEESLLAGDVDLAVHSMKDLPTELPPGLCLGAITPREDPRDCLLSREGLSLEELPLGAVVGTSSLRRGAQLKNFRPDLQIKPVRGNLDTRIHKLSTGAWDAILLAAAGLHRLGLQDLVAQYVSLEICLPAAGQGALGVELREGNRDLRRAIQVLNDEESASATLAERAFLRRLGGGCQVPIGVLGAVRSGKLHLQGMICTPDGKRVLRGDLDGPLEAAEGLGERLADRLWPEAKDILAGGRFEEKRGED
jgi:hydroxymethylbilane synthase